MRSFEKLCLALALAAAGATASGQIPAARADRFRESHWCADGDSTTAPSGKFSPNAYGLHDMIGNAWEWVEDCLNTAYVGAPDDGSAWRSGNCELRTPRGGSWSPIPADARSATHISREIGPSRRHGLPDRSDVLAGPAKRTAGKTCALRGRYDRGMIERPAGAR